MKNLLTLTAAAALTLNMVAPVYAQSAVPALVEAPKTAEQLEKEEEDRRKALWIVLGGAAALALLSNSGGSNGT